ncbi:MAG: epoxyqueuosine reductase QueH [Clostridiales bacterium]|jgi:predicted adenine nucleotide alpha hydrolase (AANH) superfamily ATPase|nr:epoxyqueuosine reductase QueH [Eubacteriales bacterium]MDH7565858.1 epoxyqueuosine reductase QueH [Clostridiales bacterium]
MKLLLHMCCAPCSVYPARVLQEEGVSFEGFFYNPNIHPRDEFIKRRENVEKFSLQKGIRVSYTDDFKQDVWENFKGSGDERCRMCYSLRLDRAAAFSKEHGFDAFTTTLLVSPYQKHDLIKELGGKFAERYGVGFYYRDFRPGFRQGQQEAKEMGLYRQRFCGCILSYNESKQRTGK